MKTRYEEYTNFTENLPCMILQDLKRNSLNLGNETNWHDNLEIQLCTEGSGYVLLDGIRHEISMGDIIVVNSNEVHFTGTEKDLKYTCYIIDSRFTKFAEIDHTTLRFDTYIKNHHILKLLNLSVEIFNDIYDVCRAAKLQATVLNILIELRQHHTREKLAIKNTASFEAVKLAIKFIRENYSKKISLDLLSQKTLIDKYNLSRNFKAVTGQTVVEYINRYRCNRAIELISEGVSINEAARTCGFNNMSFFTRTFKNHTGKLPKEYKKN